jgi:ubiquinone/menaquinone biosynthesis C-methylase UbiE
MPADPRVYDSDRLARRYALSRPPVHDTICAKLFAALPENHEVRSALDVGCGAGASAAALVTHATRVVGIDPSLPMLLQARRRLPTVTFVQAKADALPASTASIDLVTAAGSLNYTDIDLSLAEVARVLSPTGHLAVYDFSTGRVLPRDASSDSRFRSFEQRFPWPSGYPMDLARLPYTAHGLSLAFCDTFVVEISMSADEYLEYVMGETNVEAAISEGLSEFDARDACRMLFEPLFTGGSRNVGFNSVLVLARKAAR